MLNDALLLLTLILMNGVFAMSELAIVGSRRSRLDELARGGHGGATRALALSSDPMRFLSTVQVGITAAGGRRSLRAAGVSIRDRRHGRKPG